MCLPVGIGQSCGNSVVPPATISGISVTATSTGSVTTYPTLFTSCGLYTTPANSIYLGQTGVFTYTMTFSQPVNNLIIMLTGAGTMPPGGGNEVFTFTTNGGIPTIVDNGSCFTTIAGNVISSGLGATAISNGGGGDFTIIAPLGFTSLTISGPGGYAGSLLSICDQSVAPYVSSSSVCLGECINLIATSVLTDGSATYQWDNGLLATGDSVQVCPTSDMIYLAVATDTLGNVDSTIFDVVVNPNPVVNLGNDSTLCTDEIILITGFDASYSLVWQDASVGSAHVASDTGKYYVTVTEIATGCVGSDTVVFSAPPLLFDLGPDTNICAPGALNIDPGLANLDYNWNTGSTNQNIVVDSSGLYELEMTDGWCTASDSILVNFIELELDLGNDTAICNGTIILSAENIGASYLWQNGDNNQIVQAIDTGLYFVTVTEPLAQCQITDSIMISADEIAVDLGNDTLICDPNTLLLSANYSGGSYAWSTLETTQSITINSENQYNVDVVDGFCSTSDSIYVQYSQPVASFLASDTVGCGNEKVKFENTSAFVNAIQSQEWSFGDGTSSSQFNSEHLYKTNGNFFVTYEFITIDGCYSSISKMVNVNIIPNPNVNFIFSPTQPFVNDEVSFVNLSSNTDTWNWSFGDGAVSTELNPIHQYSKLGTYTVYLAGQIEHCADTAFATIAIAEEVLYYVPNAFTPLNSSVNNTFQPVFTSGFDPNSYQLTIYNRWGEVIFISNNAAIGWDGKYNSVSVMPDVYIWQISFNDINNDKNYTERGSVTVLK